jgi:CDP-glucose 4,6-dehydratase
MGKGSSRMENMVIYYPKKIRLMAFDDFFEGKKVLITGNTGFKGSWLTVWLLQQGARVTGISKDVPTKPSLFEELKLGDKIQHYFIDIREKDAVKNIFQQTKPDVVFHLAAQPIVSTSYEDPVDTFSTNVMGTANILEALRSLDNSCNAVIITSDKCYDNVEWIWGYRENDILGGKDPYSASKGAAELVIKTYYNSYFKVADSKIKIVAVRAGNVIGGGDWALNRIVPDCVKAWFNTNAVNIRNPSSTRPWQHVLEPLSGYMRVAQLMTENKINLSGEAFNFGPNADQNYTVLELLKAISEHWQFKKEIGEHFNVDINNKTFHEAGLLKLNCDKALAMLEWKPVLEFNDTAALTGKWYNSYYNVPATNYFDITVEQIKEYTIKAKQKNIRWAI